VAINPNNPNRNDEPYWFDPDLPFSVDRPEPEPPEEESQQARLMRPEDVLPQVEPEPNPPEPPESAPTDANAPPTGSPVTDAVTEVSVLTEGNSSAQAIASSYATLSQATALAALNAINQQYQLTVNHRALTSQAIQTLGKSQVAPPVREPTVNRQDFLGSVINTLQQLQ
jgi:hypothetical protein